MSTAGKVLVVLNALMLVLWLILMAGVTELNTNGAKRVEDLAKEVEKAREDLATIQKESRETLDKITLEQESKEQDLRVLRSQLSNSERAVTVAIETATRLQVQVEEYTKAVRRSQEIAEQRNQEKVQLTQDREKEEGLVKTLQSENGQLLEELQSLRTRFKKVTEDNRAEVERILKGGLVRPASRPAT